MPLPFTVWGTKVSTDTGWEQTDVANKVAAGFTKKLAERSAKAKASSMFKETGNLPVRSQVSGLADEVPVEKKMLLYFSIVNMTKGIGRGW